MKIPIFFETPSTQTCQSIGAEWDPSGDPPPILCACACVCVPFLPGLRMFSQTAHILSFIHSKGAHCLYSRYFLFVLFFVLFSRLELVCNEPLTHISPSSLPPLSPLILILLLRVSTSQKNGMKHTHKTKSTHMVTKGEKSPCIFAPLVACSVRSRETALNNG
jgi:hypothetical protein